MRRSISKLLTGTSLFAAIVCIAMLSACTTYYSQEAKYEGHHDYLVAAPVIEDLDELDAKKLRRTKVARIKIIAPDSNEKILSISAAVNQRRRQKIVRTSGDYILDQGLEQYTREALTYLFEIDRESKKAAVVEARVKVSSRLNYAGGFCHAYWLTKVSAGFLVTVTDSADGITTSEAYLSDTEEKSCADVYYVPEAEGISEIIQEAFQSSFLKAIEIQSAFRFAPSQQINNAHLTSGLFWSLR